MRNVVHGLTWLLLAASASFVAPTAAHPWYQAEIPNGGSVVRNGVAWPGVGHVTLEGGTARNAFGLDFAAAGHVWTPTLCQMDSDGDGFTNGQELGDPDCTWTKGNTPARTIDISHPGFADSVPTPPTPPSETPTPVPPPDTEPATEVPSAPPASGSVLPFPGAPHEITVPALLHSSLVARASHDGSWQGLTGELQMLFKGSPRLTSDGVAVEIVVLPGNQSSPPVDEAILLRPSYFPNRDIEALLTASTADALMVDLWTVGVLDGMYALPFNTTALQLLFPEAYAACADCPLTVKARFSAPPVANFAAAATFAFENLVGSLEATGADGALSLITLFFNGTITAQRLSANRVSILGLHLDEPSFVAALNNSVVQGETDMLFEWLVQALVTHVLVTSFNENWARIAIPVFGNATVAAMELSAVNGSVNIGADLDVPVKCLVDEDCGITQCCTSRCTLTALAANCTDVLCSNVEGAAEPGSCGCDPVSLTCVFRPDA